MFWVSCIMRRKNRHCARRTWPRSNHSWRAWVLPFGDKAAAHYGQLRAGLERAERPMACMTCRSAPCPQRRLDSCHQQHPEIRPHAGGPRRDLSLSSPRMNCAGARSSQRQQSAGRVGVSSTPLVIQLEELPCLDRYQSTQFHCGPHSPSFLIASK